LVGEEAEGSGKKRRKSEKAEGSEKKRRKAERAEESGSEYEEKEKEKTVKELLAELIEEVRKNRGAVRAVGRELASIRARVDAMDLMMEDRLYSEYEYPGTPKSEEIQSEGSETGPETDYEYELDAASGLFVAKSKKTVNRL
jgi:hypothetical protein